MSGGTPPFHQSGDYSADRPGERAPEDLSAEGPIEIPQIQIATPVRDSAPGHSMRTASGRDWWASSEPLDATAPIPATASRAAESPKSAPRTSQAARRGNSGGEILTALVVPGAGAWRRRRLFGLILLALGVLAPVAFVLWLAIGRDRLVALALSDRFLLAAMFVAVAAVGARLVAVVEVASSWRGSRRVGSQTAMALVALGVLAIPMGFGVVRIQQARGFLDGFFSDSGVEQPLFSTGPGGGAVLGPDGTLIGPDGQPIAATATGLRTVLLIGGDGGPSRPDNRTDSMMLVMVDQASGRTGLVSVARNLNRMQFPPGTVLAERYPGGFPDLANAIFTTVERDSALMEAYTVADLHPPAVALAQAIGHSLAVTIDDYFFVDLLGFSEVVDAAGGVTLELDREYPIPPNRADPSRPVPPTVGPGVVRMNGPLAMGYARTRALDSDIGRTTRQRQLLSALVNQTSASDALLRLPQIAEAADGAFLTSLSRGQLPDLMRSLSGPAVVESMGLATPLVNSGNPNWDEIRSIVDEVRQALITGEPSRFAVEGQ